MCVLCTFFKVIGVSVGLLLFGEIRGLLLLLLSQRYGKWIRGLVWAEICWTFLVVCVYHACLSYIYETSYLKEGIVVVQSCFLTISLRKAVRTQTPWFLVSFSFTPHDLV